MYSNYNNICDLSEVNKMLLFQRDDNKPLSFNIVDVNEEERAELTELIVSNGGLTTDDEDTIVKFTTQSGFGKNLYPRAKIYDTKFIFECIKESRIIDPENFRLGKKIPDDEYCMLHFLYGADCSLRRRHISNKEHSQGSTVILSDSDDLLALLKFTQSTDAFLSSETTNAVTASNQIMDIDETLFNGAIKTEPICRVSHEPSDNSQPIEIDEYVPLLSGNDVTPAMNFIDNPDKLPQNLDHELVINPQIVVPTEDTNKIASTTMEESNVLETRKKPTIPRTRGKRKASNRVTNGNDKLLPAEIPIITGDTENGENSPRKIAENASCIPAIEMICVKQEKPDDFREMENSDQKIPHLTIISEARQRSISPKNVASIRRQNMCWIPTSSSVTTKTISNIENCAVTINAPENFVNSNNDASSTVTYTNDTVSAKVTNKKSPKKAILSENTDVPVEKTKRKQDIWGKSEDEDNNDVETCARSDFPSEEIPTERGKRRKVVRENRRGTNNNSSVRGKITVKRENDNESSDSSSAENENPAKKKVKRELEDEVEGETELSGFNDQEIVPDVRVTNENTEMGIKEEWQVAGSSGIDNNTMSGENDDYEGKTRIDENSEMMNGQMDFKNEMENNDIEDDENVERIVIVPKIEHYLSTELSRGQLWRSKLVQTSVKNHQAGKFRKPFTAPERRKMLRYLLKRNCVFMAKGLVIWKEMIEDGLLTHRTPQSLQNQFQKQILPNIASASFLSESEKKEFLALKGKK